MAVFNEIDYDWGYSIHGTEADENDVVIAYLWLVFHADGRFALAQLMDYNGTYYYELIHSLHSIEFVQYTDYDYTIKLNAGTTSDDVFFGGQNEYEIFNGGQGTDTVNFQGSFDDYVITRSESAAGGFQISLAEGASVPGELGNFTSTLGYIEFVNFGSETFSFAETSGNDILFASADVGTTYYTGYTMSGEPAYVLYGLGGDDYLDAAGNPYENTGQSFANGGSGDDIIVNFDVIEYSGDVSNFRFVTDGQGTFFVTDTVGPEGSDTLSNFDYLEFGNHTSYVSRYGPEWMLLSVDGTFTDGNDFFERTVLGSTETYYAGDGDDYVDGADSPSSPSIVFGEGGNDTLFGTQVTGGEGDDILTVTQTYSVIDRFAHGGEGDDTISSPREIRYDGDVANFEFFDNQDGTFVIKDTTGAEGLDTILNIGPGTRFVFADQTLAADDIEWAVANNSPVLTLADAVDGVITAGPNVNHLYNINYSGGEYYDYTETIPLADGGFRILFRGFLTVFTRDHIFDTHDVFGVELYSSFSDTVNPLVILDGSASDDIIIGDRTDPNFVDYGSDGGRWVNGLGGSDTIVYDVNSTLADYTLTPVTRGELSGLSVYNAALGVSDILFSVENVEIGGAAVNFTPTEGVDYLFGTTGAVNALGGDDVIYMDNGTLNAGAGNDWVESANGTVYAGDGDDYVTYFAYGDSDVDRGADLVYGEDGNDTLAGQAVDGGAGDDILVSTGFNGTAFAMGGEGNDTITSYREIRYSGEIANYTLTINDDGTRTITDNVGDEGTDTILNTISTQLFVFSDITINNNDVAWVGGDDIVYGTDRPDIIFTGAGNDTIYAGDSVQPNSSAIYLDIVDAGEGDDIIFGEEGRDTLTGGPGSDIIDGGEGDDIINADSEDIFTNLTGGDGNDRLNLTDDGYVNGSLNFNGQGFESARIFDSSGTEYASYVLGTTAQNFTVNDVNNTEAWSRTVILLEKPGENNFTWVSRETVFDENDDVQLITTVFDTGRENTVEYFTAGDFAYSSITYDPTDTAAWSRVETHYALSADTGTNVRKRFVVEFDDSYTAVEDFVIDGPDAGASTRTLTDTADNESWESWTFTANSARQVTESARLNDDGILNTVTYDRDGEYDWATRAVNTDVAADVSYTSTTRELNAAGETMLFSIEYDDGRIVTTDYDLDGSTPYSRIATTLDGGDVYAWDSREVYYDQSGDVFQTFWYADESDATVTFAGNTANDRHIITLESFDYLDYASNGFETGRVFNAAGEQLGSYYTSSSGIGIYDNRDVGPDLLRTTRQLDLQDDFDWTSRDITYDLNNQIIARVDNYDDGRLVTTSYDLEGTTPYSEISRIDDRNDIFAWDAFEVYYDQSGDVFQQFYYVNAAEADTVLGNSANDRLVIESETFVDIDYAAQGFETGRTYNAAGDLLGSYYVSSAGLGVVQNNDVGPDLSRIVTQIDLQSDQDWVTRDFSYNLSGAIIEREIDYDTGFTEITEWDLDNEEVWARRETDVDDDDTESWSYVEYYYDDNDVLYDTIYYPDGAA